MLKSYLTSTKLWIKICYHPTYQKLRHPKVYRYLNKQREFYTDLLKDLDHELIFDVGANVGVKSYIFSKIAKKVLAFEPSKTCLKTLKVRFKNTNVSLFNVALGSKNELLDFYEVTDNQSYNSLSKKHIDTIVQERSKTQINTIQAQQVKTETLEDYILKYGKPSYIKIDVEGFELEVIKGLKSAVPLISFEVNLPEFREEAIEIFEYLSALSNGSYQFKFARGPKFLMNEYMSKREAIDFINSISYNVVEVYAKLK